MTQAAVVETKPTQARIYGFDGQQLVDLRKAQEAVPEERRGFREWAVPRFQFITLLDFLEWNTYHRKCVAVKATLTAGLGWSLVTDEDNKEPDRTHALITDFLMNPSPDNGEDMDIGELSYRLVTDFLATGNAALEIDRSLGGPPAGIYHLPVRNFRRLRNFQGFVQVSRANIKRAEFVNYGAESPDKNEMIQILEYDPKDDYYGAPIWLPSIRATLVDLGILQHNSKLFDNGLLADFAIIVEGGEIDDDTQKLIARKLKAAKGTDSSFKTLFLQDVAPDVKIKIEKLNIDKALGFTEDRESFRDEIITAHGVPPRIMGIVTAGQLGGGGELEGQLKLFKKLEIDPAQQRLERVYNRRILPLWGEHKWRFKFEEMDIVDLLTNAQWYNLMLRNRVLDTDEVREDLGRKPRGTQEVALSRTQAAPAAAILKNLKQIRAAIQGA